MCCGYTGECNCVKLLCRGGGASGQPVILKSLKKEEGTCNSSGYKFETACFFFFFFLSNCYLDITQLHRNVVSLWLWGFTETEVGRSLTEAIVRGCCAWSTWPLKTGLHGF